MISELFISIAIFLLQTTPIDSLNWPKSAFGAASAPSIFPAVLDMFYKLAMIAIALFNVFYAHKLNLFKRKKEENDEENSKRRREEERKITLLKSLVLDYHLEHLYVFLVSTGNLLQKLKAKDADKKAIEIELQKTFKELNDRFIVFLLATASSMGEQFQNVSDAMRDELVTNISDESINLWVERCYNDKIKMTFEKGRDKMINLLFRYDGK